jgi:hypothetical protein
MRTFSEKFAEITYNPFWRAIVIKWKDFATLEEYKNVLNAAIETAICFDAKCWVSDMSTGKAVPNIVSEWIKKEFVPRMVKIGIKKIAILLENNALRRLFAENIKETLIGAGMLLQIFNVRSDLEKWMKEKELVNKPFISKTTETTFNYYY